MSEVAPENCPEPGWHESHHYCPCCSWVNPDAPKSDKEILEELVAKVRSRCESTLSAETLDPDNSRFAAGQKHERREILAILDEGEAPE